ncbi:MAG: CHAT domain-containing protein, partial [Lacunisphaera sp.]
EPGFEAMTDRMRAVDAAIEDVRDRCNERIGTEAPLDDLCVRLKAIEAEADSFHSPIYEAKVRLEEAYVLGHAGRAAEIPPVAREARRRLLAGREPRLDSFTQSFERETYLRSFKCEVEACMMLQDAGGGLALCETVIRDFEAGRYRVGSPYRQSAVLGSFAEFYQRAALFAFKLQRWDAMLEAIELIKARSAVRTRLAESQGPVATGESEASLMEQFTAAGRALAANPADGEVQARRRFLWDLLSIVRARDRAPVEIPEFTLASLQAALAEDEALIGYFWLGESTILALAVDAGRFHAERINLEPPDLARFNEWVDFVRGLKTASGSGMDKAIQRLGAILLPGFLRDFIGTKKRLILSPHHALHLFPFHAVRWDEREFVATRFAVRYVPNFSSLLQPWVNHAEERVLTLAIDNFSDPAVPPLRAVERDSEEIGTYYRTRGTQVEALTGTTATRMRFEELRATGALATFRCIHFGTHGLSVFESPNEPMEAKLLLQDGALDCMDLAGLHLTAELAVVSACNSGQRAVVARGTGEIPGDDIFGLQSALFQAGVRCVLGTLWLVETESASAITRTFHRHFAASGEVEVALQNALRDYLADPQTAKGAFYWAPYFISCLGNARNQARAPVMT